jgi:tetratricopeptide (TPR) repeat protein
MQPGVRAAVVMALMIVVAARAADGDGDWIGRRVITRYGATLHIGGRVIDDEGRDRARAASGKDRRVFRVYRVERVEGPWLWLVSETQGISGWARAADVVPLDRAIDEATAAIRADPSPAAHVSRGLLWQEAREYARAIADYNEAIRLDPWSEAAYQDRANALEAQGRYAEALADYDAAIRLDPGFDLPYNSRAWMRATCPDPRYRDGRQAVADALRACRLGDWKEADYLGTLAAASAEAGDFDEAVRWQTEAIRLHRGAEEDRRGFVARLELYRARKPYRAGQGGR